ncbi:hypothetical protein T11_13623 [Trichinella zimbabwensis]|uniref:Uncharacterized protein n=1 Tax=Trichinella zimbabwensis TaxID=268475 RepID=A0A0V1HEJ9_9BILA|nr:hypothetical protein T11_13623 [Trichinella zimbabwensis]
MTTIASLSLSCTTVEQWQCHLLLSELNRLKTKRYIEVPTSAVVDDCVKSLGEVDVSNLS